MPPACCTRGDFKAVSGHVESQMLVLLNAGAQMLNAGFPSPSLLMPWFAVSSFTGMQEAPREAPRCLRQEKLSAGMKWSCR